MAKRSWSATPSLHEVVDELKRELGMRDRVFQRQVEENRMRPDEMRHKMACIERAIAELEALAGPRPRQGDLF